MPPIRRALGQAKDLLRGVATRILGARQARRMLRRAWRLKHRRALARHACSLSEAERKRQGDAVFPSSLKFSVVTPLYNTPEKFLREMLDSVIAQTYGNWEICLADGSDEEHESVQGVCETYAARDARIRYQKLGLNLGISENTNRCLAMASGDYIALLDHDDVLHPSALYACMEAICQHPADLVYTDEATFEGDVRQLVSLHLKPDFAPDNLRANNFICHLTVFKRDLLDLVGAFRKEFDGSQDHDLILRLTERAQHIAHIPKVLYYWRSHPDSSSDNIQSKMYAVEAGKAAVQAHLGRRGEHAEVESGRGHPAIYRLRYAIPGQPLLSILIANKDHPREVRRCVSSVLGISTYANFEVLLADDGSTDEDTLSYYRTLSEDSRVRILRCPSPSSYPAINNLAADQAKGEYLVLLSSDTQVIAPAWLEEMLMFAQRPDVGAVGAMLCREDGTIHHAGLILGAGGIAGRALEGSPRDSLGFFGNLCYARDVTAVTSACMMVRRQTYKDLGGLDERFAGALHDVDLCLRIRREGLLVVFTPFAELYTSRGQGDTPEQGAPTASEAELFRTVWHKELAAGDPFYNPNLSLTRGDYAFR